MKAVEFPEQTAVLAKDQPEYVPLPVHVGPTKPIGFTEEVECVITCWELSDGDLELIKQTKRVWVQMLTFGTPLQPLSVSVEKPFEEFE